MSLTIKQEIMHLQHRSYTSVNEILIRRQNQRLPEQMSARLLSIGFCLELIMSVVAFSVLLTGALSGDRVIQIVGGSLLIIGIVGLPIFFYFHNRVQNFEVPEKEIDAYFAGSDRSLRIKIASNQRKMNDLAELNKKLNAQRTSLG